MAEELNEDATIAYMRELMERDAAGERTSVVVGPWSAISMIILLQTTLRLPGIPNNIKTGALHIIGELEPLFAGTYGEKLIAAGYDTSQDIPAGEI